MFRESFETATTGATTGPGQSAPRIRLLNDVMWRQFNELQNEMIVTKQGRRLFPHLSFQLADLHPKRIYSVLIELAPADDHHWKFTNTRWVVCGKANKRSSKNYFVHPDSPNSGAHWMKSDVVFSKLKITNDMSSKNPSHIVLNSMERYQPLLHVAESDISINVTERRNWTHCFTETQFTAVTAYQNTDITQLKIEYNPFAKGFRNENELSSKYYCSTPVAANNIYPQVQSQPQTPYLNPQQYQHQYYPSQLPYNQQQEQQQQQQQQQQQLYEQQSYRLQLQKLAQHHQLPGQQQLGQQQLAQRQQQQQQQQQQSLFWNPRSALKPPGNIHALGNMAGAVSKRKLEDDDWTCSVKQQKVEAHTSRTGARSDLLVLL